MYINSMNDERNTFSPLKFNIDSICEVLEELYVDDVDSEGCSTGVISDTPLHIEIDRLCRLPLDEFDVNAFIDVFRRSEVDLSSFLLMFVEATDTMDAEWITEEEEAAMVSFHPDLATAELGGFST